MYRSSIPILVGTLFITLILFVVSSERSRADAMQQEDGQIYIVQPGDSLVRISSRFYGDATLWDEIYQATNAMAREDSSFATIQRPSLIYSGQKLWIPNRQRMAQPTESTQQPVADMPAATAQASTATATASPTAEPTAEPDSGAAADTPADFQPEMLAELISPFIDQLVATGESSGALVDAQEQTALARQHLGFLQQSLADADLPTARQHAEHVINILEGEAGVLYGDNDRNGQTQNPGDGVGIRAHLIDSQMQSLNALNALEEAGADAATSAAVQQVMRAIILGRYQVQSATERAFQVFAADTVAEVEPMAADVETMLSELEESIIATTAVAAQLIPGDEASPEMADETTQALGALFDEGGLLVDAQEQTALARQHLGFLQQSLADADLPTARQHAEHVINILEGEAGALYGDNDRNGQTQNPGDGVGIRIYLSDAHTQVQDVIAALEEAGADAETIASVGEMASTLAADQTLVEDATERAFQVFAADTVAEVEPMAADVETMLTELEESIIATTAATAQLIPGDDASPEMADETTQGLGALFDEEGLLTDAQEQTALARQHLGFLQQSLADADLPTARQHAEHVINILEGEAGALYGDNDRNGQTQNPGDGVGIRIYLSDAHTQVQDVIAALEEAGADAETIASVEEMASTLAADQTLVEDATERAFQVFAADTVAEVEPMAADVETMLTELEESLSRLDTF